MFSMQRKQQKCASRLSLNAISVKFGLLLLARGKGKWDGEGVKKALEAWLEDHEV
jgi:hypothetical protein